VHYKRKTAIKQWREEEFIKKSNQTKTGTVYAAMRLHMIIKFVSE
jgi:hypothetical protein